VKHAPTRHGCCKYFSCRTTPPAGCLSLAIVVCVAFLCMPRSCNAGIQLHGLFGDLMMLQRDVSVPVKGTAAGSTSVQVEFAGQKRTVEVDSNGSWQLVIGPLKATTDPAGYEMRVRASNGDTLVLKRIVVGDVWVCSGDTGMAFPVLKTKQATKTTESANYPNIRFFSVWGAAQAQPTSQCGGVWTQCNPGTVEAFSAVGYTFGRRVYEKTHIPIGLIRNAWDNTRISAWTPVVTEDIEDIQARQAQDERATPKADSFEAASVNDGHDSPQHRPAALYNGLIAPLTGFPVKGVLWYQGVADLANSHSYQFSLVVLITGWRNAWAAPRLPFGIVEMYPPQHNTRIGTTGVTDEESRKAIRNAQRNVQQMLPDVGLVRVTGLTRDTAVANYEIIGDRLADWALADVYHTELSDPQPAGKSVTASPDFH